MILFGLCFRVDTLLNLAFGLFHFDSLFIFQCNSFQVVRFRLFLRLFLNYIHGRGIARFVIFCRIYLFLSLFALIFLYCFFPLLLLFVRFGYCHLFGLIWFFWSHFFGFGYSISFGIFSFVGSSSFSSSFSAISDAPSGSYGIALGKVKGADVLLLEMSEVVIRLQLAQTLALNSVAWDKHGSDAAQGGVKVHFHFQNYTLYYKQGDQKNE